MGRFFISCDDARILSTRNQYNELNAKEKFRHGVHTTHCLNCKKEDQNNHRFTKQLNKLHYARLSSTQKSIIKALIKKAIGR